MTLIKAMELLRLYWMTLPGGAKLWALHVASTEPTMTIAILAMINQQN